MVKKTVIVVLADRLFRILGFIDALHTPKKRALLYLQPLVEKQREMLKISHFMEKIV